MTNPQPQIWKATPSVVTYTGTAGLLGDRTREESNRSRLVRITNRCVVAPEKFEPEN